jgi:hypothetical protein
MHSPLTQKFEIDNALVKHHAHPLCEWHRSAAFLQLTLHGTESPHPTDITGDRRPDSKKMREQRDLLSRGTFLWFAPTWLSRQRTERSQLRNELGHAKQSVRAGRRGEISTKTAEKLRCTRRSRL